MTRERRERLKREWKNLGRRATRAYRQSGGTSPRIDELFARMDKIDDQLHPTRVRRPSSPA